MRLVLRLLTIEPLRALARNKVRALLAILGIMIGVATVIAVIAIGHAGTSQALSALDALGENLVWIEAGSRNANGVRTGSHGMETLVPGDAQAIRDECPLIARCSENIDGRIQVIGEAGNWLTQFRGVSPEYLSVRRWDVARGEFFTDDDVVHATPVLVIGATVASKLFGDEDPIGGRIRINKSQFTVVGVLAAKGQSATGQDQDDTIMMPWTTTRARIVGKFQTWLDDILCSAVDSSAIKTAGIQVGELLRDRHRIATGADDFNIRHPEDLAKAKIKSAETLERLLLVIGSLAMMVGGVGIMNVMLASVAQRTTEIGIRVAIGARPSAIRLQFLGEAMMLTAIGGGLGVLLGATTSPAIARMLGWEITMSPRASVIAFVSAVAVGVFFGFYPALRASRLDPIEALRAEV
ncbi:MAG: ABC transporter permease [Deltaproteobacteria bacterium]